MAELSTQGAATTPAEFPIVARLRHGGHLAFDRPLPLVCFHDRKARHELRDVSLELLTRGSPNHLIVEGAAALEEARPALDTLLAATIKEFGHCALVVLAEPSNRNQADAPQRTSPVVTLRFRAAREPERDALRAFQETLCRRKVRGLNIQVRVGDAVGSNALLDTFDGEGISRI